MHIILIISHPGRFVAWRPAVASERNLRKSICYSEKMKDNYFRLPELSPMFSLKDDDLNQILGIITRIADGQGLMTDSGVYRTERV